MALCITTRDFDFFLCYSLFTGIVGRTGAGKSTILQALFRMCEPEGDVLIDGVNSAELGLHTLRRSISVIPQESLLFSASLKVNMDPFREFSDEQLWNCLEQVGFSVI